MDAPKRRKHFFSIEVFFHGHSWITRLQGKGESISLTPHYHFQPLHRRLDISRAITTEVWPLHIASSRTRTGNRRKHFPNKYATEERKVALLYSIYLFSFHLLIFTFLIQFLAAESPLKRMKNAFYFMLKFFSFLRILTGRKHHQIKLQHLQNRNMGIWIVGISNQLFIGGS